MARKAAERVRLHRDRRSRGVCPVTVEISEDILERLRERELLLPGEEQDSTLLSQAIGVILEDALSL